MTNFAREFWLRAEPLHAVTYFSEESTEAAVAVGFKGWWMGYFGFRAAPLGEASAALVNATFYNFHPAKVANAVPDAWTFATPAAAMSARSSSAASVLRRTIPDIDGLASKVTPVMASLVAAADPAGRPLFAANQPLRNDADPVEDLWQTLTSWREHRGDSHVAALRAADLDGCEVHVLHAATSSVPAEMFRASRGWSDDDWDSACQRLAARGLADSTGLTPEGHALKEWVEASTDRQAMRFFDDTPEATRNDLLTTFDAAARSLQESGVLRFPNPMGLPKVS